MWFAILLVFVVIITVFMLIKVKKKKELENEEKMRIANFNALLNGLQNESDVYIQGVLNDLGTSVIMRKSMIERGVVSVDTMECNYPNYYCKTYGEVYALQQKALRIKRNREIKNKTK